MEEPTGPTLTPPQKDVYEQEFGHLLHLKPRRSLYAKFYKKQFRRLLTLYKFLPVELIRARIVTLWKNYMELQHETRHHNKREKPVKSLPQQERRKVSQMNKLYKAIVQADEGKNPRKIMHAQKREAPAPVGTLLTSRTNAATSSIRAEDQNIGLTVTSLDKVVPALPSSSTYLQGEAMTSLKDLPDTVPDPNNTLREQSPRTLCLVPDPNQGTTGNHQQKHTSTDVSAEEDKLYPASAPPQNADQPSTLSICFKDKVNTSTDKHKTEAATSDGDSCKFLTMSRDYVSNDSGKSTAELSELDHGQSTDSDPTQTLDDVTAEGTGGTEEGKENQSHLFNERRDQSAACNPEDDKRCGEPNSEADTAISETISVSPNEENMRKKKKISTSTEAEKSVSVMPITEAAAERRSLSLRGKGPRYLTYLQSISEKPEKKMDQAASTDEAKYKKGTESKGKQQEDKLCHNLGLTATLSPGAEGGDILESVVTKEVENVEVFPPNSEMSRNRELPGSSNTDNTENATGNTKSLLTKKISLDRHVGCTAWKEGNKKKPRKQGLGKDATPSCHERYMNSPHLDVLEPKLGASYETTKETANKNPQTKKDLKKEQGRHLKKGTSIRWGKNIFYQLESPDHGNEEDLSSEISHAEGKAPITESSAEIKVPTLEDITKDPDAVDQLDFKGRKMGSTESENSKKQEKEEGQHARTTAVARVGHVSYEESGHSATKDSKKKKLTAGSKRKKALGSHDSHQASNVPPDKRKQRYKEETQQKSKDDAPNHTTKSKTEILHPVDKPLKAQLLLGAITDKNTDVQKAEKPQEQHEGRKLEQASNLRPGTATQQTAPTSKTRTKEVKHGNCSSETKTAKKKKHQKSLKGNDKEIEAVSSWPLPRDLEESTEGKSDQDGKQQRHHGGNDGSQSQADFDVATASGKRPGKGSLRHKLLKKKDEKRWSLKPIPLQHLGKNKATCQGELGWNDTDQADPWNDTDDGNPCSGTTLSDILLAREEKTSKRKKEGKRATIPTEDRSTTRVSEAVRKQKKSRKSFPSTEVTTRATDTNTNKNAKKKRRHILDAADSWIASKARTHKKDDPEAGPLPKFSSPNKTDVGLPKEWGEHLESYGDSSFEKAESILGHLDNASEGGYVHKMQPSDFPSPSRKRVLKDDSNASNKNGKLSLKKEKPRLAKSTPRQILDKEKEGKKQEGIQEDLKRKPSSSPGKGTKPRGSVKMITQGKADLSILAELNYRFSEERAQKADGSEDSSFVKPETGFGLVGNPTAETSSVTETQSSSFPSPDWECGLRKYDDELNRKNAGKLSAKGGRPVVGRSTSGSKPQKTRAKIPGPGEVKKKKQAAGKAVRLKSPVAVSDETKARGPKKVNVGDKTDPDSPAALDYNLCKEWDEDMENFRGSSFQKAGSAFYRMDNAAEVTFANEFQSPTWKPGLKKHTNKLNKVGTDKLSAKKGKSGVEKSSPRRKPKSSAKNKVTDREELEDRQEETWKGSDKALKTMSSLSDEQLKVKDSKKRNTKSKTAQKSDSKAAKKIKDSIKETQGHSQHSLVSEKVKRTTEEMPPRSCEQIDTYDGLKTKMVGINAEKRKGASSTVTTGGKSHSVHPKWANATKLDVSKRTLQHEAGLYDGFRIPGTTQNGSKADWISPDLFPSNDKSDAFHSAMKRPKKKKQTVVRFAEPLEGNDPDSAGKENRATLKEPKRKRRKLSPIQPRKAWDWSHEKRSRSGEREPHGKKKSEKQTGEKLPPCRVQLEPLEEWDLAGIQNSQGIGKTWEVGTLTASQRTMPKTSRKPSQGSTEDASGFEDEFRFPLTFSSSPY